MSAYELFQHNCAQKAHQLKNQGASEEAIADALKPSDDDPLPLSPEEEEERNNLLQEGFGNWSKRDFSAFTRGCEKYGRGNIAQIAAEIEGKSEDDVKEYASVFWKRAPKEMSDWEKIIKNIEKGEMKLQKFQDNQVAVAAK